MIKKTLQKLFKTISYSLFFKIYGKIEKSINCKEDNRINVKIINLNKNLSYKVYKVADGRLYTDRIHDTAIILDDKIINEASFQLRQTYDLRIFNSKIENNIVFEKGTPRKLKHINGNVLSMLTGGGGNDNYWHWLFDVLPRLFLYSKTGKLNDINFFLIPNDKKNFQSETLDLLSIPKNRRLSSEKYRHIKTKNLITTDHPVVTTGDATKDIMNMPLWISEWLKDTFVKKNKFSNNIEEKIFIDRRDSKLNNIAQRTIKNDEEVRSFLSKNKFTSVKLHETPFIKQVELFNNAKCIVGLHGGGFANLAFCKPGTKIIEIRSKNAGTPIENLARKNNLNYNSLILESVQIEKYNYPNQQGSIEVPLSSLAKFIEK